MPEEIPEYGHGPGKRKACDVPDEPDASLARCARKKRKTLGLAASGTRVSRYGGPAQVFVPQDIGNASVPVAQGQPQEGDVTFGHAEHHWHSTDNYLMSSSSCQILSEVSLPRDAQNVSDIMASPWAYYNNQAEVSAEADNSHWQYVQNGSFKIGSGQGGPAEGPGPLPSAQNCMAWASCTLEEYPLLCNTDPPYYIDRLYGYNYSEHIPVKYSIPPNSATEAICRSSSDAVPLQELQYDEFLSTSSESVLSEVTAVRDASYASNKYFNLSTH